MSVSAKSSSARRIGIAAIAVAALQTAILGYTVVARATILWRGTDVLLKTAPVDPRDLLRGDYVVLSYDISNVPTSTLREQPHGQSDGQSPSSTPQGDPVSAPDAILSVRLKKQPDGFWGLAESSFGTLEPQPDTVVLRSRALRRSVATGPGQTIWGVNYGIERYYIPEGEGDDLEQARNAGQLSVAIRVSSDGQAQIKALLLDGKPLYQEPLY